MAVKKSKQRGVGYLTEARIANTLARAQKTVGSSQDRIRESQKARERARKLIEESHRRRKRATPSNRQQDGTR
jgi:hypothetical protein